jgi:hypothetical protein
VDEARTSLGPCGPVTTVRQKIGHQPEATLPWRYDRESGKESCEA